MDKIDEICRKRKQAHQELVTDCESCMQWHIEQAAKAGANQQEVLEAIEVGMEMGGGQATVSARFALEVMEHVFAGSSPR
jgi:alkylhydroperoxidase/carboxymuconolactone decarboxylase family protein YurZ